jgi:cellulose 1,4-beta-cellobiosidase
VASATPDAPSAPEPPTNLVATPGKKKKIELSWTQPNPAASVLQNRILRSQSASGPFTEVALVNATTSYSDPGLSSGTTYYYQVTALTAGGESAPSGTASATAP